MASRFRSAAGFTLLEMLVSLTLLTLIVSITFSAFITLNKTSDRLVEISADTDVMLTLSRFFQQKIAWAQPVTWVPEGFDQAPQLLIGTRKQMTWLSVMNPAQPLGGVHYLRLELQDDQRLTLALLTYSGDPADWQQANSVDLLADVTRFALQYRAFEDAAWRDEWLDNEGLPDLVRIQLTQLGLDWPDQVIRVLQGGR